MNTFKDNPDTQTPFGGRLTSRPLKQTGIKGWKPPYETDFSEIAKARPITSVVTMGIAPLAAKVGGLAGNMLSAMVTPDDRTVEERIAQNVTPVARRTAADLSGFANGTEGKLIRAPKQDAPVIPSPLGIVPQVSAGDNTSIPDPATQGADAPSNVAARARNPLTTPRVATASDSTMASGPDVAERLANGFTQDKDGNWSQTGPQRTASIVPNQPAAPGGVMLKDVHQMLQDNFREQQSALTLASMVPENIDGVAAQKARIALLQAQAQELRQYASPIAQVHGSDQGLTGHKYSADQGLTGHKYTADQNVAAHKIAGDSSIKVAEINHANDLAKVTAKTAADQAKSAAAQIDKDLTTIGLALTPEARIAYHAHRNDVFSWVGKLTKHLNAIEKSWGSEKAKDVAKTIKLMNSAPDSKEAQEAIERNRDIFNRDMQLKILAKKPVFDTTGLTPYKGAAGIIPPG